MTSTAPSSRPGQGRGPSVLLPVLIAPVLLVIASTACSNQTDRELQSALREVTGQTTTTTTTPAPTTSVSTTSMPPSTTVRSTTTTTVDLPRIGDGRTISRETAVQTDRCFDGWQTMRSTADTTGLVERADFDRTEHDCDRAIDLLARDRTDEATDTGPTAQLNFVLLQLRLQWIGTGLQFAAACPGGPGAPCALTADDLGGSFDFLVITEPSSVIPNAFVGEFDDRIDISAIPGLRVD